MMPEDTPLLSGHNVLLDPFIKIIDAGGPVMFILLLMSLFGLTVFILKLIQFWRSHILVFTPVHTALAYWKKQQWQSACSTLSASKNPAAKIVESAMSGIRGGYSPDLIREEVERMANETIEDLRSYLRAIEVIASLGPLLGLFGTVLGIIDAFHQMEKAGSNIDPSQLSGGIWVALLTTAAGLAVGMPAVAALNYLESRIERFAHLTENLVTQVFTHPLYLPVVSAPDKIVAATQKPDQPWISNSIVSQSA